MCTRAWDRHAVETHRSCFLSWLHWLSLKQCCLEMKTIPLHSIAHRFMRGNGTFLALWLHTVSTLSVLTSCLSLFSGDNNPNYHQSHSTLLSSDWHLDHQLYSYSKVQLKHTDYPLTWNKSTSEDAISKTSILEYSVEQSWLLQQ